MNYYYITFNKQPSIVVEAPDSTSAKAICRGRIRTCEEISGSHMKILVECCGFNLVKWPF